MDTIVRAKVELEDGTELNHFHDLAIHQKVNDHHTFELRCPLNAMEAASEPLINKSQSLFGKIIKVGFQNSSNNTTDYFFKGLITQISIDKYQGIGGDMIIKGYSPTILLEEGKRYGTVINKSVSQAATQVMSDIPSNLLQLHTDVESDGNVSYKVQYKQSSFDFLKSLAHSYSQWLYFDGTQLYFGKRNDENPIHLTFGTDVTNMQLDYKIIPSRFDFINYNTQNDAILTSASTSATAARLDDISNTLLNKSENIFNKKEQIIRPFKATDQSLLDTLAGLAKNRLGSQYIYLSGSCNNPNLKIGKLIEINGPNRSDNSQTDSYGKYRIISLEQSVVGGGGYSCKFEAISSYAHTPPGELMPDIALGNDEYAEVKDNKDPLRMGRITVQHLWQTGEEVSPWLDCSQIYAGDQRGFYWVPEIGDRVIIGFMNGNPNFPYVKGSVYRKDHLPIHVYEDDNSSKAIALSKNMLIQFDSKHVISGQETEILGFSSYDENGAHEHPNYLLVTKDAEYGIVIHSENHKVLVSADTIKIQSRGETVIDSGGGVTITSGGKMTLDAGQNDLEIKAMNIKIKAEGEITADAQTNIAIKAQAQVEVVGSAHGKFDGGAMTEIIGGMIKLN